jgi:hypothetical protein
MWKATATLPLFVQYTNEQLKTFPMKFFPLLLAAALCSFTAATAQTAPQAPSNIGTTPTSAAPAIPARVATPSDIPATGAPDAIDDTTPATGNKRAMKHKKEKNPMREGKGKMKTKM